MLGEFAPLLVAEAHQDIQRVSQVSHRAEGFADCATSGQLCKDVASANTATFAFLASLTVTGDTSGMEVPPGKHEKQTAIARFVTAM